MGNGITQVTAAAGYNVTMVSQGEERKKMGAAWREEKSKAK